jgi:ubiquinone/menaquinone biosynthesis C-methylase UbiE
LDEPLQQAKAKAAATYDAASDHFDDEPLHFWERKRTVDRLALVPGAKVLDVGCGTVNMTVGKQLGVQFGHLPNFADSAGK